MLRHYQNQQPVFSNSNFSAPRSAFKRVADIAAQAWKFSAVTSAYEQEADVAT